MLGNRKNNYVCFTHKYSRKGYGLCPICRTELSSIGERWRIGRHGNFDKIERKTRNFKGQKPLVSYRRLRQEAIERQKKCQKILPQT